MDSPSNRVLQILNRTQRKLRIDSSVPTEIQADHLPALGEQQVISIADVLILNNALNLTLTLTDDSIVIRVIDSGN